MDQLLSNVRVFRGRGGVESWLRKRRRSRELKEGEEEEPRALMRERRRSSALAELEESSAREEMLLLQT